MAFGAEVEPGPGHARGRGALLMGVDGRAVWLGSAGKHLALQANAVVHALPPAVLRLPRVGADGRSALRVEVTDAGPCGGGRAAGRPSSLRGRARPRARHRHRPVGRVRHARPRGRHTVGGAPRRVSRWAC